MQGRVRLIAGSGGVVLLAALAGPVRAAAPPVVRAAGDPNADGTVNIADAICMLGYLFGRQTDPCKVSAPRCEDAADANDDGKLNIADAIATLGYLFGRPAGIPLPPPGAETCGDDTTEDTLEQCVYPASKC